MAPNAARQQAPEPLDIDQVFRAHGAFVGRVIRRLTSEGPHVDDLVQETFVVAYKKRAEFEGRSSVQTWLYAIARNLCFRHERGHRRFEFFRGRLANLKPAQEPERPDEQFLRQEAIERVQRSLGQLPFKQREVVVLYELEGLEGKAISKILDVPLGTVWTRLTQGRKTIERQMRREAAKEGRR